MNAVRVTCPDCGGTSTDTYHPACGWCMNNGWIDIDKTADGQTPLMHPDGRMVHPWAEPTLPVYASSRR
jgi:DnaJ-class molecular chaperone